MTDWQTLKQGVIDRVEGDKAVIKLDDGQQVIWPVSDLPEGLTEGNNLRLVIFTAQDDTREREALARQILNEILKDQTQDGERP